MFAARLGLLLLAVVDTASSTWRRLDGAEHLGKGLARFDSTDYAFAVTENLRYCRQRVVSIAPNATELDFGPQMAAALRNLSDGGGGTLRLLAGVYWIQSQIEIPSFTCLQGAGAHKTVLRLHAAALPFNKTGMIRSNNASRVSVFDLTQDGNRANVGGDVRDRTGILTYLTNYVWLKNVRVMNNAEYGFDPHGANTSWSYYLVIEGCHSENNGKDGFTIDQYYYVSMINSTASRNARHGINLVSGTRYALVKNNRLSSNAMCSVTVQNNEYGTRAALVMHNVGVGHSVAGICVRNTKQVHAVANMMHSDKPHARMYQLHHVFDVTLLRNEWVRTPKHSGMMFHTRGDNDFSVEQSTVLLVDATVSARYQGYLASIDRETKQPVDLNDTTYGTMLADNGVATLNVGNSRPLMMRSRLGAEADPMCTSGVRNGPYCCAASCDVCVGLGCPEGSRAECCGAQIREDAYSCDTYGAPCYLSRKHTAPGRLYDAGRPTPTPPSL